jgi:hypothetical protein
MVEDGDAGLGTGAEAIFGRLLQGALYRFADWPNPAVPRAAPGAYRIWDLDSGTFL